jgi:hypothetical protein
VEALYTERLFIFTVYQLFSSIAAAYEGFRNIVKQKISYGCEQESQDLI